MNDVLNLLRENNPVPVELAPPPLDRLLGELQSDVPLVHRARRRRGRPLAVLVAVSVVVALVVGFAGRPGSRAFDVRAAVYRATAPGHGIVHVVLESTQTYLAGSRRVVRSRVESWSAPLHDQQRQIQTQGSHTIEQALDGHRQQTWTSGHASVITEETLPRVIGHPEDPVAGVRAMLRGGRARVVARARLGGRDVWRLQLNVAPAPAAGRFPAAILLVDANTFVPIQLTSYGGGISNQGGRFVPTVRAVTRYLTYERLPYTANNRALLGMSGHPGAQLKHR
jgi:hypothetical protein